MQLIRRALLFRPDLLAIFSVISFVLIMALGVLLASGIADAFAPLVPHGIAKRLLVCPKQIAENAAP